MCLDELVDNVHLMIQTNTEGKITFEGNAGVYMVRGALYLNNANISDKTCMQNESKFYQQHCNQKWQFGVFCYNTTRRSSELFI